MREPAEPQDISEMQQTKASRQGLMTVVGCCIVLSCIGGGQTLVGITIPSICAELNIATGQAGLYLLLSTFTALGGSRAFVYLGIMAVIALVVFNAALSLSPIKKMRKANNYLPEQ